MTENMRSMDESEEAIGIYQEALGRVADEKWDKSVNHDSGHAIWNSPEPEYQRAVKQHDGDVRNSNESRKRALTKRDLIRLDDENKIRRRLGLWALIFVGCQLAACDALVAAYVIVELVRDDMIAPTILTAWMGASLVEIIGILWVIARSLFPFRDKYHNKSEEKE